MQNSQENSQEDDEDVIDGGKTGFDAPWGKFIKSYNGNGQSNLALKAFHFPINYPQLVLVHPLLLYSVP